MKRIESANEKKVDRRAYIHVVQAFFRTMPKDSVGTARVRGSPTVIVTEHVNVRIVYALQQMERSGDNSFRESLGFASFLNVDTSTVKFEIQD